ncbi:hypothetical protein ACFLZP_01510 [Patescibacteria group bacterium]
MPPTPKTPSGHQKHILAEKAREKDQHLKALKFIEEAIVFYQQEKDYFGLGQALQSRFLIYKHLFLLTKDEVFALMGQKDVEVSLYLAKKYKLLNLIGSCYFRLGESASLFKNYPQGIIYFKKALKNYQGSQAEKGDYRYHLGVVLHKSGREKQGLKTILQGLEEIRQFSSGVNPFLAHVWESGCLLQLAKLLKIDQPQKAKKYLMQALKITNADKDLVIRRRQIKEIADKLT